MFAPVGSTSLLSNKAGRYQAFPFVASNGDTVLAAWRDAVRHYGDTGSVTRGTISVDGGRTWATPTVWLDDGNSLTESNVAGLVWNARRQRWTMLVLVVTFAAASDTIAVSHAWRIMESANGSTWTARGANPVPKPAGVGWWFAAGLYDDGSRLLVTFYGDGGRSGVMASTDDGLTWGAPSFVSGPTSLQEPQMVLTDAGDWLVAVRGADNAVRTFRVSDPADWSNVDLAVAAPGYSGQPTMVNTGDGSLLMLLRKASPSWAQARWAYAESVDDGVTWAIRGDFPDQARTMLYGGLAVVADGSVVCVYSSEIDGSNAIISAARFARLTLSAVVSFERAAPAIRVTLPRNVAIYRTSTDALTGDEVVEQVRVVDWDGQTATGWDTEAQQGTTYTYMAGELTSDPITMPEFDFHLVHPQEPDWSVQADVVSIGGEKITTGVTVTPVPYRDYPITTSAGPIESVTGDLVVRTSTLIDKQRMRRLLRDNLPIFLSHHVGLDVPSWVRVVGDVTVDPGVQMCSHNLDDSSDPAQWRYWSLSWVEQARPTAIELPVRKRVRDYKQPIETLTMPIGEM